MRLKPDNIVQLFSTYKQHPSPITVTTFFFHSRPKQLDLFFFLYLLASQGNLNQETLAMNTPSTGSESSNDFVDEFSYDGLTTNFIFFSNEFPNDDLKDLFRRLHRHSKDRRFTLLATFLENCARVLREETSRLPQHMRELIPPFEDLFTLVDGGQFRLGPLGASMESAFLCALQVAMIIG